MIVVDSSVFVALLLEEPEVDRLRRTLIAQAQRVMSAGTYLECAIVAAGRGLGGRAVLDDWLARRSIEIVPVDLALAQIAADAFVRYGKGRHPAALNYGDCCAYALARSLRAPLLYKGADFALTDIEAAPPG